MTISAGLIKRLEAVESQRKGEPRALDARCARDPSTDEGLMTLLARSPAIATFRSTNTRAPLDANGSLEDAMMLLSEEEPRLWGQPATRVREFLGAMLRAHSQF